MKPIKPPFPFPTRWLLATQHKLVSNSTPWTVPSSSYHKVYLGDTRTVVHAPFSEPECDSVGHCTERVTDMNNTQAIYDQKIMYPNDSDEFVEEFVLNDFWASRLSKTLKRLRKKPHKSNRKF